MAEKSEHESSKTGQPVESPETEAHRSKDAEGDAWTDDKGKTHYGESSAVGTTGEGEPVDAAGKPYPSNPEQPQPYSESDDFVPDPTAMSGTLETSGTGGGIHESLKGTTGAFTDLPNTVEVHGLPLHRNEVVSGDGTGQPEPHRGADANVATTDDVATDEQKHEEEAGKLPASDAGGVDGGVTHVAPSEPKSYSESTIAGAADPNARRGESISEGPNTTATREDGEKSESEAEEGEEKESEGASSTTAKKTAAKKTTARKTTASKSSTDK